MIKALRVLLLLTVSLLFTRFLFLSISGGSAVPLDRPSAIAGVRYSAATDPSQYWLMVALYFVGEVGFAYWAWREYNG